jgi:2-C-methyl-D-erythritol 2,4-cyclodiphosphate synthase
MNEVRLRKLLNDVRTGFGFDVHQFANGDHIWLGGIRIAHSQSVTGHSDADVVLHALVDAVLGALAEGDIGVHFPPSDPQWRGAASSIFLAKAVELVRSRGGLIANVDITILAEIDANARLQLAPAANVVVMYLRSGDEYTMRGPALIEFRASEPVAKTIATLVKPTNRKEGE